ncbi:MAG: NAD(P)-dependent oxidoreductase [Vicinamibacterales bacterium]
MVVLVADKFEQSGLEGLRAAGCEVSYQPDLTDERLVGAVAATGAHVLVVRSTKVSEAVLDAGRLSLVVRAGAGYNTIDVTAASRRGIYVSNCPGRNAVAVAELAFALMLAIDRRVPDNVVDLRAGTWNKKEYSKARGLQGSTLGLLGAGSIAAEMVKRAAGFGMPVVVWSRRFDGQDRLLTDRELSTFGAADAGRSSRVRVAPTPTAVAAASDVLSIHLALTPETRLLVDRSVVGALKPGAMLLNTARAEVLDYDAVAEAVRARGLRVGLDVYPGEPTAGTGAFTDPLVALPGVYGTHHIGASTDQAQEAIAAETVRIVDTFKTTGRVPNVVNLAKRTPATHMLVVRHKDRPGVLAHVFDTLHGAEINAQETENIVFEGAEAAVARINLDRAPSEATLQAVARDNHHVLDVQLVTL